MKESQPHFLVSAASVGILGTGFNQMLVSATGGDVSLPSKNHVKIGSLRKLTCERLFRMATCHWELGCRGLVWV